MTPDPAEPQVSEDDRPTCPACGHINIPGAAFCARCGRSLRNDAPAGVIDVEPVDAQATSAFAPVTSTVTPPPESPWARPGQLDSDPGATAALPAYAPLPGHESDLAVRRPEGMRGFWLGVLAALLIFAVLAVYVYASWLSDSTRSTIDGWLPWALVIVRAP